MSFSTTKATPVQSLDGEVLRAFKANFQGRLLQTGDQDYHEGRNVYNAMIDKQPGLIAYCTNEADVIKAVRFARDYKLDVAIRGGGHNGAGLGMCDGGLCIDLSRMKKVRVNQQA
ncbi:MAG: FAD-dependent oxidoreductase, partial [Bacteroidetes bacterium]|nr:FAD-dependent oxidoreductase [Bacteroidota bacterium]